MTVYHKNNLPVQTLLHNISVRVISHKAIAISLCFRCAIHACNAKHYYRFLVFAFLRSSYQDHKFERGGIKSSNQSYHGLNKGYVTKVFLRLILVATFQLCL